MLFSEVGVHSGINFSEFFVNTNFTNFNILVYKDAQAIPDLMTCAAEEVRWQEIWWVS